jgi:hypothetical protein
MLSNSDKHAKGNDRFFGSEAFLLAMAILASFGGLLILLYSLRFWASGQVFRIFGVGMLVAGAAMLSGFLLGFIFAIPRMGGLRARTTTADPNGPEVLDSHDRRTSPQPNDNLVEISDWLTKIIVGVGLIELHTIPAKLGALSYYLAPGLQPAPCAGGVACAEPIISGQSAGLAIIIFYFCLGFLLGCVWTMVFFMQDLIKPYKEQIYIQEKSLALKQQIIGATTPILSAEAAIRENQFGKAMATIEESLKKNPEDGYALMTKARVLKRQALQAGQSEDERIRLLNESIACIDQAIALLPGKGDPIYNKACYLALLNPAELAGEVLANLEAAFRLNPALRQIAKDDTDLSSMREIPDFVRLIGQELPPQS